MALDREQHHAPNATRKDGRKKLQSDGNHRQAAKTASLALQRYAPANKRQAAEPITITKDPETQAPAVGQTVIYRVNLPVNGKYRWRVDSGDGFEIEHPIVNHLRRAPNEWAITWSKSGDYKVICEVLYLPQPREEQPVPFTVIVDVCVSTASSVAHDATMKAMAAAAGSSSYETYHARREREHAEMTGKGASPFANEASNAMDPFIGAMPIHGPVVLEGKSHEQTYVLNYWKGDPASLKWLVIPRSPNAKGQRLVRVQHGETPTFSFTEPGLYDVVCTQRVTQQRHNGSTTEEFVPVTATVQAILSANGKAQADELRKKIGHADTLIAKIAKDKETHQSRAVAIIGAHVAAAGNKVEHLPLFIGPSAEHNDQFVVVDLRPGVARSEHVGDTPEAALSAFETFAEKNYPKGSVDLRISANSEAITPQHRSFDTQSKLYWDHVGEQIGWISAGLMVAGLGLMAAGVTAPVGMIMLGAAAAGTIAGAATLKGHIDEGATAKQYTIDVMQLTAALIGFRAFGNLAAYAMQVPNVAKSMIAVEFGLNSGSIGLMSTDVAEELVKVNSDSMLSQDERDTRRWQIALNMLGQAGFFWLGYRGAKNDFKITNQVRVVRPDELEQQSAAPNRHEPGSDRDEPSARRSNVHKWAKASPPTTKPASAFVIRDSEMVPVRKKGDAFYDPQRRRINPEKERIHRSMAGGAPDKDPVDVDFDTATAFVDEHLDSRTAQLYREFMTKGVYEPHFSSQEVEGLTDASAYMGDLDEMAAFLEQRLQGTLGTTGRGLVEEQEYSRPSLQVAQETLDRIREVKERHQNGIPMSLGEYGLINHGFNDSFGYSVRGSGPADATSTYPESATAPFRLLIESFGSLSYRKINDSFAAGIAHVERLRPTEMKLADGSYRDHREFRAHDQGHYRNASPMPNTAQQFLRQNADNIDFYRGFQKLRQQFLPRKQEILDIIWFDITRDKHGDMDPQRMAILLDREDLVAERIHSDFTTPSIGDHPFYSLEGDQAQPSLGEIKEAVKLIRNHVERRAAAAPEHVRTQTTFKKDFQRLFGDDIELISTNWWLLRLHSFMQTNLNRFSTTYTPDDYAEFYPKFLAQWKPAPQDAGCEPRMEALVDLVKRYREEGYGKAPTGAGKSVQVNTDVATQSGETRTRDLDILQRAIDAGPNKWVSTGNKLPADSQRFQRGLSGNFMGGGDGVTEAMNLLNGEVDQVGRFVSLFGGNTGTRPGQVTIGSANYTRPLAIRGRTSESNLNRSAQGGPDSARIFSLDLNQVEAVGFFTSLFDELKWAQYYKELIKRSGKKPSPGSRGEQFIRELDDVLKQKKLADRNGHAVILNSEELNWMLRKLFEKWGGKSPGNNVYP